MKAEIEAVHGAGASNEEVEEEITKEEIRRAITRLKRGKAIAERVAFKEEC